LVCFCGVHKCVLMSSVSVLVFAFIDQRRAELFNGCVDAWVIFEISGGLVQSSART